MVLGEIVQAVFPETIGSTIEISVEMNWSYYAKASFAFGDDEGHRTRTQNVATREKINVDFRGGRPFLDVEHFLGYKGMAIARKKAAEEEVKE